MLSRVHLAFHARIHDFSSGGSGSIWQKKPWQLFFFLVLSLFYWSQMVNFEENYHFSRFQRGSNIFQGGGGPTFSKGVQLLIPYRNPYNFWFSRGPDPLTPLWIRTCYLDQQEKAFFRLVVVGWYFSVYLNFDRPWFCKRTVASGDPTCGSRGGLGGPDPPGKSQVIWVSLDTPTPWKKLDPLLPSVIKPLDPLCKL